MKKGGKVLFQGKNDHLRFRPMANGQVTQEKKEKRETNKIQITWKYLPSYRMDWSSSLNN